MSLSNLNEGFARCSTRHFCLPLEIPTRSALGTGHHT